MYPLKTSIKFNQQIALGFKNNYLRERSMKSTSTKLISVSNPEAQTTLTTTTRNIHPNCYQIPFVNIPKGPFYKKMSQNLNHSTNLEKIEPSTSLREILDQPVNQDRTEQLQKNKPLKTLTSQKDKSVRINPRVTTSPNVTHSKIMNKTNLPVRATLKHLLNTQPFAHFQKVKKTTSPQNKTYYYSPTAKTGLVDSERITLQEKRKGEGMISRRLFQQNSILKEENELLRKELEEIKRIITKGTPKEELITNLRHTIKKEDHQNKELKLKIEILNKKNIALQNLLTSKEEEIHFLERKVQQIEREWTEERQRDSGRMDYLKEKVIKVSQACQFMERHCANQENEWISFQEKWQEEKTIYLHRITFLEQYISQQDSFH